MPSPKSLDFSGYIWIPGGHFMAWSSGFISWDCSMGLVPTIFQACMSTEDSKLLLDHFLVHRLSDCELKELWPWFDHVSLSKSLLYSVKSFHPPCTPKRKWSLIHINGSPSTYSLPLSVKLISNISKQIGVYFNVFERVRWNTLYRRLTLS